jgi:Tol biopolymer transport system component
LGVLAAILIGTTGFLVWRRNAAPTSSVQLENVAFSSLTDTGNIRHIAISPDGQFLAFIRSDSEKIWLKDINSKQDVALNLAQTLNPQSLVFSPDGNSIYFLNRKNAVSGAEVYRTARFGGNVEFVAGNVWSEFSISADGGRLAFYRKTPEENRHQLVIANLSDRSETALLVKDFPDGFDLRSSPAWSQDGKHLYAISKPQEKPASTLIRVDAEAGKEEAVDAPQIRQFVAIAVTPNNRDLIFTAREQNKFPQIYKMATSGGPVQRLTNDLNLYRKISLSGDGKSLVALQKNNASHLWIVPDLKAGNARQLTFGKNNRDAKQGLDVLPDGRIVYTSLEDLNRDLWILDPRDNSKQQLTVKQNEANERPFVSKDGEFIFFSSLDDQTFNLSQIRPNGQDYKRLTFDNSANDLFPNITADGSALYFIRKTKGRSFIVKRNVADGQETEIALPDGFSPDSFLALSPDGRFLAFRQTDIERRNELEDEASHLIKIGVVSTENDLSNARTLTVSTSQSQFRWNDKSDAIYSINHSEKNSAIWKQAVFTNSEPIKIVELIDTRIYHFQITHENDLVVSQGKTLDDAVLVKNF